MTFQSENQRWAAECLAVMFYLILAISVLWFAERVNDTVLHVSYVCLTLLAVIVAGIVGRRGYLPDFVFLVCMLGICQVFSIGLVVWMGTS